ncbi:MAG TPA: tetratricopeptide repeat protein, partial [Polyangiaceae bacterium]|nr:tetratricopeptide repeat protein [Polyangiaceae bacterium]
PARLLAVREPISPWLVKASPDQKQAIVRSAEGQGLVLGGLLSRARELDVSNHSVPLYEHQIATTLPYYEALAALYPDDADRQFEAATQLAALGHPSHAGRYYERALALRPEDYRFRLDYGHWLLGLGRGKEAIEVLSSLRDDVPRAALVHYNLGAAVLASGEAGAAAGHFETALGYDDTLYGARIGLARARIALSEEEKAQRALARSQADNPWDEDVMHLWGILRTRQGRWEEAESLLRKAHRWAPYRSDILLDLGRVQARRGNLRDAEKSYVLLLRYAPQDPAGWLGLADAMAASKRWAEAAGSYAKVLELDSVSVAAALGLGESLEKLQRNDSARDAFCLALHLQPGQQRAQAGLKRLEADCSGNASNDDHTPK